MTFIDLDASEENHYHLSYIPSTKSQLEQEFGNKKDMVSVYISRDKEKTQIQISKNATILELKEKYLKGAAQALTLKFMGMLLNNDKTLPDYTIGDQDCLDATLDRSSIDSSQYVKLKLRFENEMHSFKISPIDKLEKLFEKYANKINKPLNHLKFIFDGYSLSPNDSCQSLELENNFIIDVQEIH
ncbi:hypothetical protein EDI_133360 [Entamoeba dispar SAW760]|uniref:Ubiquitin-like domain-containing protein n=1 Tax=Entamoeba dispar (strain ATCC PRA-260 / SAW760) TaxID=370354 RepID=B0EJF4_ENTDS|nr:uncharacterized protein EDI_133360 [Entamoeba dispar SAW760]EDR25349.1 hypothetical protein EDI_133360 [Entamoeba dispar SAW760]|eukprot:EDR25349.1 hypothetical protein EDI_133360 [Entamoeba dispar SAW760]